MKIEKIKVDEIIPYADNAKLHPERQIEQIRSSILEFGFNDPIAIDENNVVIEGNGRLMAIKDLGFKEVDCIRIEGLTEDQKRAYILVHNQLTMNTGFDIDILNRELEKIKDIDMTQFDFEIDIDFDLNIDLGGTVGEDNVPEPDENAEPKAKFGDIYQLGRHRLMCGDSTKAEDIDRLMDGVKADMVLSDPPYGMNLDTDFSTIKGSMKSLGRKNHTEGNKYEKVIGDNEDFKPELITTFFANFEYVKEMFLFGADYFAELLPDKNKGSWLVWDKRKESQADAIGSEFELIWSRNKHKRRMLRHDWFGFLSSENGADARNRVHPTQKPITLLVDILNQWGKDAKVIVDLYGGSGSTLIACEQLDRSCYMMELDPRYVDVIIDRWEKFTGQKAELIEG